jgi:membrane-bound lytic murein transglycosylase A
VSAAAAAALRVGLGVAALAVAFGLGACASRPPAPAGRVSFEAVPVAAWPALSDDLDRASLEAAVAGSLAYLDGLEPDLRYRFGREERTAAELARGLRRFAEIVGSLRDGAELREALAAEFVLLVSAGRDGRGEVLFTGYYEPVHEARRQPSPPFVHPLYGWPYDLVTVDVAAFGLESGPRPLVGRIEGRTLVPYPERRTIDFGVGLAAGAPVLGYLADPVDVFFLHVQGSGTLIFEDGSRLRTGFATTNGRDYRSIGRLLLDEGLVERSEMSMQAIRSYLAAHPEEVERVLSFNPSYVFFRPLPAEDGPPGCFGVPLTPGRSIATDRRLVPAPVAAWVQAGMPAGSSGQRPISRFVLSQDTGSAIRGPGRVDVFIGAGEEAAAIAGRMQSTGRLYLLLPRAI